MTTLSKCKAVELFRSLYFSLVSLSELNSLQNCGSTEQRAVSLPVLITSKQRPLLMHICSANLAHINKHIFKLKSAASRGDPAAWVLLDQAGKHVLEALGQLISLDGDKRWHQVWLKKNNPHISLWTQRKKMWEISLQRLPGRHRLSVKVRIQCVFGLWVCGCVLYHIVFNTPESNLMDLGWEGISPPSEL